MVEGTSFVVFLESDVFVLLDGREAGFWIAAAKLSARHYTRNTVRRTKEAKLYRMVIVLRRIQALEFTHDSLQEKDIGVECQSDIQVQQGESAKQDSGDRRC
jgi:hypothetical protein